MEKAIDNCLTAKRLLSSERRDGGDRREGFREKLRSGSQCLERQAKQTELYPIGCSEQTPPSTQPCLHISVVKTVSIGICLRKRRLLGDRGFPESRRLVPTQCCTYRGAGMNRQVRGGPSRSLNPQHQGNWRGTQPEAMLPRTLTVNYDRLTDPRAVTPCVSGCPHLSSLQTAPASSIQARLLRLPAAGSGRERVLCLRRAKKARDGWTFSQLQTLSPKARPLLPPAPPRHPLNGEPRACACAAGSPRTIASAQAQSGPGVLLPVVLCGRGAQRRVVPEGVSGC